MSVGSSYDWEVRSACSSDSSSVSSWSSTESFATPYPCTIPQNLTESGITSTTATLSWDLVPGSWGYVVMHRQVGSAWVFDTVNTNSLSLTTLNSGATHKWRVYSLCTSSGSSVSSWSSMNTFLTTTIVTPGPMACTSPQNLEEENITSSSVELEWDALAGSWGYKVMWRQLGSGWNYTLVNTNELILSSLNPNKTHKWRVYSVCDSLQSNVSAWSSMQIFNTLSSIRIASGDTELSNNLNIYPNPTKGMFNISFITEEVVGLKLMIVDAYGKTILIENNDIFIGEFTKQVDLSEYPKGIYMVQIRTNNSFITKRIVVQ